MFDPDTLVTNLFNRTWADLHRPDWDKDEQLRFPGVYVLAYTSKRLAGRRVHVDNVYYVGMSNSAGGVRARLNQFKSANETGGLHSGGKNFFELNGRKPFSQLGTNQKFYFAALASN